VPGSTAGDSGRWDRRSGPRREPALRARSGVAAAAAGPVVGPQCQVPPEGRPLRPHRRVVGRRPRSRLIGDPTTATTCCAVARWIESRERTRGSAYAAHGPWWPATTTRWRPPEGARRRAPLKRERPASRPAALGRQRQGREDGRVPAVLEPPRSSDCAPPYSPSSGATRLPHSPTSAGRRARRPQLELSGSRPGIVNRDVRSALPGRRGERPGTGTCPRCPGSATELGDRRLPARSERPAIVSAQSAIPSLAGV
jgi:hypothetical protein